MWITRRLVGRWLVAADDYRQRRKDGEFSVEHEVSRLRRRVAFLEGQLEKADRLAEAGRAAFEGGATLVRGREHAVTPAGKKLADALSDYSAARKGEGTNG